MKEERKKGKTNWTMAVTMVSLIFYCIVVLAVIVWGISSCATKTPPNPTTQQDANQPPAKTVMLQDPNQP